MTTIHEKMEAVVKTLQPSGYKMGDLFTLILTRKGKNVMDVSYDTRQYYSGRGSKYNSSIRHGDITERITKAELDRRYKPIGDAIKEQREYVRRCNSSEFIREQIEKKVIIIADRPAEKTRVEKYYWKGTEVTGVLNRYWVIDGELINTIEPMSREKVEAKFDTTDVHYMLNCHDGDFYGQLKVDVHQEEDERYWINGYFGSGVYRLAVQSGKIVASIYGGYRDSCPYLTDQEKWREAIDNYLKERLGDDYTVVKADGSGTYFYLRDGEDLLSSVDMLQMEVNEYNVPSVYGGLHHNIEVK